MTYQFNPHRHVKIWLSKNENVFLNLENQLRLVKMRTTNPDDKINFIYDSRLLTKKAQENLTDFCIRYNLIAYDFAELKETCQTTEERNLLKIYEAEIKRFNDGKGGNPAAASDILRWLKPVYTLGTYADFDTAINTQGLAETIDVEQPLLISLGSIKPAFITSMLFDDKESILINNDIIAIVDAEAALKKLQEVQRMIYSRCQELPIAQMVEGAVFEFSKIFLNRGQFDKKEIAREMALKSDANINCLNQYVLPIANNKTIYQLRAEIIKYHASNENYLEFMRTMGQIEQNRQNRHFTPEQKIAQGAEFYRQELKKSVNIIGRIFIPKNYHAVKNLLLKTDEELLTFYRNNSRMQMLKVSVMYFTGPHVTGLALFKKTRFAQKELDSEVKPFSFAHYGLDKAFLSNNSLPFHASSSQANTLMSHTTVGTINDLSWLDEGVKATEEREEEIRENIERLRWNYHVLQQKVDKHIDKINSDLNGFFGSYRRTQRQAKVTALTAIKSCFNEEGTTFNCSRFDAIKISEEETPSLEASLGRSQTMTLIRNARFFSRHARELMLDNTDALNLTKQKPA